MIIMSYSMVSFLVPAKKRLAAFRNGIPDHKYKTGAPFHFPLNWPLFERHTNKNKRKKE